MTVVAIHQPNYVPWLGYFHKIVHADVFVFLDDVQFSRGSYTNRVQICRDGKAKWLTQPVRHAFGQAIGQVEFADGNWPSRHLDSIRGAYEAAPAFADVWDDLIGLYETIPTQNLAAANIHLVRALTAFLGLTCDFLGASNLGPSNLRGDDRLIAIIEAVAPGATYLSGRGGTKYQDPQKFESAGIDLRGADFEHPIYAQEEAPFISGLSILDAAFRLGWAKTRALLERG